LSCVEAMTPRCNVCGSEVFKNAGTREKMACAQCGSLERTRVIQLIIDTHFSLHRKSRILHIAPEPGLAKKFYQLAGKNCTFADLGLPPSEISRR